LKRAIGKAERRSGDGREIGGTGATVLRLRAAPLVRLIEKRRIGTEEVRAADDITTAFHAQAGALMVKSPAFEKLDAAYDDREPVWIGDACGLGDRADELARCGRNPAANRQLERDRPRVFGRGAHRDVRGRKRQGAG
jgi:hypothetical protein